MNEEVRKLLRGRLPDDQIETAALRAEYAIRAYCHIPDTEEIQKEALFVWADMAVAGVRMASESGSGAVQSVSEGDTTVTYARSSSSSAFDISADFATALQSFRRLAK